MTMIDDDYGDDDESEKHILGNVKIIYNLEFLLNEKLLQEYVLLYVTKKSNRDTVHSRLFAWIILFCLVVHFHKTKAATITSSTPYEHVYDLECSILPIHTMTVITTIIQNHNDCDNHDDVITMTVITMMM